MSRSIENTTNKKPGKKRLLGKLFLAVVSTILALKAADLLLPYLGVDDRQLTHPSHYRELRNHLEFEYEFTTNSQGLRYHEIPLRKEAANEFRVLVVGDSFTEGWGVDQADTFSSLLESQYSSGNNMVRFINAGLTGTGPDKYVHTLSALGLRYDIDSVLICIYANDLNDMPESSKYSPASQSAEKRDRADDAISIFLPTLTELWHRATAQEDLQNNAPNSSQRTLQFAKLDTDGDGFVDEEELQLFLENSNSEQTLPELFRSHDANDDGEITRNEANKLPRRFAQFDRNNDGSVNLQEFTALMELAPTKTKADRIKERQILRFQELDRNDDARISKTEWQKAKSRDLVASAAAEARRRGITQQEIDDWVKRIPPKLLSAANEQRFNGPILAAGLLHPDYWTEALDLVTDRSLLKMKNMKVALDFAVKECRDRKISVGVVYIPCYFQYDPDSHQSANPWIQVGATIRPEWLTGTTKLQDSLREWAMRNQVAFFDLTTGLRVAVATHEDSLNYPLDGHWNPDGHRVAADLIRTWLDSSQHFPDRN